MRRRNSGVNRAPLPARRANAGSGGSGLGEIGITIAGAMALYYGLALSDRAIDAVLGPCTSQRETVASNNTLGASDACNFHSKEFQDCLNNYGNDISKCQYYMDMLAECRRN